MEMFEGMGYEDIMSMPSSRRFRICLKKRDLEEKRRAELKAR